MADPSTLSPLEISSLLASKICHDLISPIGAIQNGMEVIDDEGGEVEDFALDLIRHSTERAVAKLKFARIAFGSMAGNSADHNDLVAINQATSAYKELCGKEGPQTDWQIDEIAVKKPMLRLIANLLFLVGQSIIRGNGVLTLTQLPANAAGGSNPPARVGFDIIATGKSIKPSATTFDILSGDYKTACDPTTIQPYLCILLARQLSAELNVDWNDQQTHIAVRVASW